MRKALEKLDLMSFQLLISHFALAILGAVKMHSWLFLLDAFIIVGAIFAFFALARAGMRLTPEQARQLTWEGRHNHFQDAHRYIVRANRFSLGFGVGTILIWLGLSLAQGMTSERTEIFLGVIFGGVFLPTYLTMRILGRAFERMAERLEGFAPPSEPSPN